jgi:hypothetical protein
VSGPAPAAPGDPLQRSQIDEALVLARFCQSRSADLRVEATGSWKFPIPAIDQTGATTAESSLTGPSVVRTDAARPWTVVS